MPLSFHYIDERAGASSMMWRNPTGKRLFLNADQTKVVMEDSPEASFVLIGPSGSIPVEDAVRYGLMAKDDLPDPVTPAMPEATAQMTREVKKVMSSAPVEEETESMEEESEGLTITEEDERPQESTSGTGSKMQRPASDKSQAPKSDK